MIQGMRSEGKTVFFSTHILSDAEALCDRVAVIYQGELRGVGAVAQLMSQARRRVEIIFCAPSVPVELANLGAVAHVRGEMVNAEVDEEKQDEALEILRREHIRLISLTPVRSSLEEYYVQKLQPRENGKGAGA
jgi:ABC-2 type transport system ATP-binding protein